MSITFVPVSPLRINPPAMPKKWYASCRTRYSSAPAQRRVSIRDRTGRVGGAILAVGAAAEYRHAGHPDSPSFASTASTNSRMRPPFPGLSPSVTAVSPPGRMHASGFSGTPSPLDTPHNARNRNRNLSRFAFHIRTEIEDAIPEQFGLPFRGVECDAVATDDVVLHAIGNNLRCFRQLPITPGFEMPKHRGRSRISPAHGRVRTASASANVVGSGAVGPEAITSSGSPTTSETMNDTSRLPRNASASRPPFTRERCLRTQFISSMVSPTAVKQLRHGLLVRERNAFYRCREQRGAATGEQAHRDILLSGALKEFQHLLGHAATPSAVGSFTPCGRATCSRTRFRFAVIPAGTFTSPSTRSSRSSPSAASNPAAMPGPALPAPTTITRCRKEPLFGFHCGFHKWRGPHGINCGGPDTQRVLARHYSTPVVEVPLLQ